MRSNRIRSGAFATAMIFVSAFSTDARAQTCPCSVWSSTATVGAMDSQTGSAELGMKFTADVSGTVTAVRFYKYAQNTGTHVGNLWTSTGTLLGSVTFTSETASGWQQASFASPIPISANTTYVVSYHLNVGYYASTTSGLASAVDNPPLHALASGTSGGNGVYAVGTGTIFPNQTWNASNYWVDLVFVPAADTTPPTVVGMTPAIGATGVPVTTALTATFSETMTASSIGTSTVLLTDPSNMLVPATVTYNATTSIATLTPGAALAPAATYTATVKGGAAGVRDAAGNAMVADVMWSFATAASAVTCPCSIWASAAVVGPMDNQAASGELGVKFRSDINGYILGVRFYKYPSNSGTHLGNLWTSSGTRLASVTFANESASGWQQATFSTPVAVTANTTYVASYHTNTGFYAATSQGLASAVDNAPLHALASGTSGGNGVYVPGASAFPSQTYNATNYWVDVVFSTSAADTTPPVVTATTPASGAMGVATTSPVTITFSEALDQTTISGSTIDLRTSSNTVVPSTLAYNSSTWTVTLTPSSALVNAATYTATVRTCIKDLSGNNLAAPVSWSFATVPAAVSPTQGAGGPILVVTSAANPFTQYYPEILRAEGLTEFAVSDIFQVSASALANYDLVVLGEQALTSAQASMFSTWVQGGGNLIALRPDKQLAGTLGLAAQGGTIANTYLAIDPTQPAGAGLDTDTLQFHGTADAYVSIGATVLATLYADPTHATTYPAATLYANQNGQAAAFTFDLARSVVYTRQGSPAWAGEERDGVPPIRSDDLYYGAKSGDIQPDWVDLNKVAIPQADEQQRLFANLILLMNASKRPLPRFWYLPRGAKAAVVMTADDHDSGGVSTRFTDYLSQSAPGCSVDNWECVRSTAYVYPAEPMTDSQVASWIAQGFEVGLHVTMDPTTQFGCGLDFTASTLLNAYTTQLSQFKSKFPSAGSPVTHRMHCITWSDWSTQPTTELGKGIRLDTSYYYAPDTWVENRPGFFTGSGMPMRYATIAGAPIDVYQATTQMTDESGQTYPMTVDTLLNNALGSTAYYGVLTANIHTDAASSQPIADSIVASAKAHGVAVVSAKQMLTWLDARNNSVFRSIGWNGATLTFSVAAAANASGLQVMVPVQVGAARLTAVALNGAPVTYATQTIKGLAYAVVSAAAGQFAASYAQ